MAYVICARNTFLNTVSAQLTSLHIVHYASFSLSVVQKIKKIWHTHILLTNISRKVVHGLIVCIYIWLMIYGIGYICKRILILRDTKQKSYFLQKSIFYVGIDLVHKIIREWIYFTSSSHKIHIENTNFLCVFQNMLRNYM